MKLVVGVPARMTLCLKVAGPWGETRGNVLRRTREFRRRMCGEWASTGAPKGVTSKTTKKQNGVFGPGRR